MSKKNITTDEVKHIAKLSKLTIKDSELDYYAEEMNKIIDYFDILSKVDAAIRSFSAIRSYAYS